MFYLLSRCLCTWSSLAAISQLILWPHLKFQWVCKYHTCFFSIITIPCHQCPLSFPVPSPTLFFPLTPAPAPLCVSPTLKRTLLHWSCVLLSQTRGHTHTQINAISCTYHWANWYFSLTVMPLGHVNNYIIFSDVNAPVHIIFPLWWAFDPLPHPLVLGTLLHEPSWSTCLSLAVLLFL